MKNNKKITKFKYENVIYRILVLLSTYNATLIASDGVFGVSSNFVTLIVQICFWLLLKYGLRYIRKNPGIIKSSWTDLFMDK